MAPTVPSTATANDPQRSRQVFGTLEGFLQVYGDAEFTLYRKNNAAANLTYADWASSEHVLGPFLYHLTLDAWDEGTSSDDGEPEEPVKRASPGLPERMPTVTTNGNGVPHNADSPAPSRDAQEKESSSSTKRRQRRKKIFLSEAIVASEDSDDNSTSAPVADAVTPPSAATITNGRTSSLVQRQKKAPSSPPNLPPKNLDEPARPSKIVKLSYSGHKKQKKVGVTDPIVSPKHEKESTPVAESVTPSSAMGSPEGSTSSSTRRGLRVRTPAQQRPYFHHAKLFDEAEGEPENDGDTRSPARRLTTKLAQVVYPDEEDMSSEELHDQDLDDFMETEPELELKQMHRSEPEPMTEGEPMPESELEVEPEPKLEPELEPKVEPAPELAPLPKPTTGKKPLGRPKGRKSKKNEIDEDPEFNAPKNVLQTIQSPADPKPKRKSRTRKSLALSEAYVLDSSEAEMERLAQSDEDFDMLHEDTPKKVRMMVGNSDDDDVVPSPARKASAKVAPKPGGRYSKPRTKPKKSASIVVSSDDDEDEDFTMGTLQGPKRSKSNPRPKTPEWDPLRDILLMNAQMAAEARLQQLRNGTAKAPTPAPAPAPAPVTQATTDPATAVPDLMPQAATTPVATAPVRKIGRPRKSGSNGVGGSQS